MTGLELDLLESPDKRRQLSSVRVPDGALAVWTDARLSVSFVRAELEARFPEVYGNDWPDSGAAA